MWSNARMGLLKRVLRREVPIQPPPLTGVQDPLILGGHDTLEVVGESFHQAALWRLVGGDQGERVRFDTQAILDPEPTNPHDTNAIRVLIQGNPVGHLGREDAAIYLSGLRSLIEKRGRPIGLCGQIVGGGFYGDRRGMLGVFLDHDPADFGLSPHHVVHIGELRTGLSEAIVTDLADDRYDLSWLGQLSGSHDLRDAGLLRDLLAVEHDPIDRHFMLSELSRCLYKGRNSSPLALDEFDAVCAQHFAEMEVIRPALLEKFGQIPLVDVFRQAAIRCQKAHDWPAAARWAERGLSFYGTDAARPEAVDDLHKRLSHAQAKMAAPVPKPARAIPKPPLVADAESLETLTCMGCGSRFERERTRGRKPHLCPTCRDSSEGIEAR